VCIFVYVGANRPLESADDTPLRLTRVKHRHEKSVLCDEYVYLAFGGCACDLTLDGADDADKEKRQVLLDALSNFLSMATMDGPVRTLVTDGGREPPKEVALLISEVQHFDFDSAWEAPSLLTIGRG
jgi:hypothetical protein